MTSDRKLSSHGYLGSTSYASVFFEHQSLWTPQSVKYQGPKCSPPISDVDFARGADCLSHIKELFIWAPLVEQWAGGSKFSMISPWIQGVQDSLRSKIAAKWPCGSSPPEVDGNLRELSREIWVNSLDPIPLDGDTTFEEYQDNLGRQLRWESVGMYFLAVGLALEGLEYVGGATSGHDTYQSRRDLSKRMLEESDTCIRFSDKAGQITDLQTWLYLGNWHLCTLVDGDAAFSSWRKLGDLISICVAQGLHQEIKPSAELPFWMSELRKRVFGVAYNCDKAMSNFLGRPPRLPRKFCSMQLPLDLEPEQLRLPPHLLEQELNKLDENGWNVHRDFRSTVHIRTGIICHMINEDILELMMCSLPLNDEEIAQDILRRSQSAWDALPDFVKHAHDGQSTIGGGDLDLISLDFRLNDFLLHRVLVRKQRANSDELIRISMDLVTRVIQLIRRHHSTTFTTDLPWIIAKFALPPTGVLCIELLQQSQGHRVSAIFNRSAVIQSLSNLMPTLRWITMKRTVNHEICEQARFVIQKILDIVLDGPPPPPPLHSPQAQVTTTVASEKDAMGLEILQQTQSEVEFWNVLPRHPLLAEG